MKRIITREYQFNDGDIREAFMLLMKQLDLPAPTAPFSIVDSGGMEVSLVYLKFTESQP